MYICFFMSTQNKRCSFCLSNTHYINKCNHDNVHKLRQNIQNIASLNYFWNITNNNFFLLQTLHTYSIPQLRIIGYQFQILLSRNPDYKIKEDFINKIIHFIFCIPENKHIAIVNNIDYDLLEDYIDTFTQNITYYPNMNPLLIDKEHLYNTIIDRRIIYKKYFFKLFNSEFDITHNSECPICYITLNKLNTIKFNCSHLMCIKCFFKNVRYLDQKIQYVKLSCSLCRTNIITIYLANHNYYNHFYQIKKICTHHLYYHYKYSTFFNFLYYIFFRKSVVLAQLLFFIIIFYNFNKLCSFITNNQHLFS